MVRLFRRWRLSQWGVPIMDNWRLAYAGGGVDGRALVRVAATGWTPVQVLVYVCGALAVVLLAMQGIEAARGTEWFNVWTSPYVLGVCTPILSQPRPAPLTSAPN